MDNKREVDYHFWKDWNSIKKVIKDAQEENENVLDDMKIKEQKQQIVSMGGHCKH